MNRSDMGPLLLVVAGVLMLLAVAAYAFKDEEYRAASLKQPSPEILRRLDRIERTLEALTPR